MKKWNCFSVKSPTEIVHQSSHSMGGHPKANDADTKTRAIFVLAAKKPPYNVYGNPFYDYAGFGNVFSVDQEGGLKENVQNYEYCPKTAIHGMVFDPTESYVYSADMWANKVWCHKKDAETGHLTTVGSVDAPAPGDHPRWVAMHPSGNYLYALMEGGNRLAEYVIDPQTHVPVCTHRIYPLVPPGKHLRQPQPPSTPLFPKEALTGPFPFSPGHQELYPKMYRSDVVFLSHSAKYMFATSRSNSPDLTGYIAAFKLSDTGSIERQICLNPTPTSGGHSNAISPCDWSDEWLALTDDEKGFVEIYRWKDEFLGRVAHCDVSEPGFGMNAIWYD